MWVLFDDKTIGKLWRQKYSAYYTEGIAKTWTPIFGVNRHFSVSNGKVTQTQFPLKPASGTTIHSAQGCTFDRIYIDMDLSDSPGLTKNQNLAKPFLQHVHYVAASRVTTLEGSQIISWKPKLISVNKDVKEHMDYLKTHRKVQLCYTPVCNMLAGMKCSFLNTRSLYDTENVKANLNICASDVIFLAETRLVHSDDNKKYEIPGFEVSCRNDQLCNSETRPPHGLISYVRDTVQILGHEIQTSPNYESIFLCVQHSYLPIPVQLILIYLSPHCQYVYFTKNERSLMNS